MHSSLNYLCSISQNWGVVGGVADWRHSHSLRTNNHSQRTESTNRGPNAQCNINYWDFFPPSSWNPTIHFHLFQYNLDVFAQIIDCLWLKKSTIKAEGPDLPCWAEYLGSYQYRRPLSLSWSKTWVGWEGNCSRKPAYCSQPDERAGGTNKPNDNRVVLEQNKQFHKGASLLM